LYHLLYWDYKTNSIVTKPLDEDLFGKKERLNEKNVSHADFKITLFFNVSYIMTNSKKKLTGGMGGMWGKILNRALLPIALAGAYGLYSRKKGTKCITKGKNYKKKTNKKKKYVITNNKLLKKRK
jgi:hypothetical protein